MLIKILSQLLNKKSFKNFYLASNDEKLYILDLLNKNFKHYILDPIKFYRYVEYKLGKRIKFIEEDDKKDFYEFFLHLIKNNIVLISLYDEEYKRSSTLFCFKFFNKFIECICKLFDKVIEYADGDIHKLMNRKIKITFFVLPAFEVTGSMYQFFNDFEEGYVEIKASFGVIHDSNNTFDFYVVDKQNKKIINQNITSQKSMNIIYKSQIINVDIPYKWQREKKLTEKNINQLLEIFEIIKQEVKKPIEIYYGILNKKIYIYDINLEYDGVSDYLNYQIEGQQYRLNNLLYQIQQGHQKDIKEDLKNSQFLLNNNKNLIKKLNTKL